MAKEKTPMDLDVILKEEAERHNLEERELQMAVREELTARVAKKIVERIIAGEVAPPAGKARRKLKYALGR